MPEHERINVVVGVIFNADGEVLLTQRSADVHKAKCWEFPGGKVEENESDQEALARELKEELGIEVTESESFVDVLYDYPDKAVCLVTFLVKQFSGEPKGLEGQPMQWVKIEDLPSIKLPEANALIVENLINLK